MDNEIPLLAVVFVVLAVAAGFVINDLYTQENLGEVPSNGGHGEAGHGSEEMSQNTTGNHLGNVSMNDSVSQDLESSSH